MDNKEFILDAVPLTKVKKLIARVEQYNEENNIKEEDCEVSFELLIGSLYPQIMKNINSEINRQYTLGYMKGLEDNENKRNTGC